MIALLKLKSHSSVYSHSFDEVNLKLTNNDATSLDKFPTKTSRRRFLESLLFVTVSFCKLILALRPVTF